MGERSAWTPIVIPPKHMKIIEEQITNLVESNLWAHGTPEAKRTLDTREITSVKIEIYPKNTKKDTVEYLRDSRPLILDFEKGTAEMMI